LIPFVLPPMAFEAPELAAHYAEVRPFREVATQDSAGGLPPRPRDLNDFTPGTIDVRGKLAFDGVGNGPFSLVGSFIGWNEIGFGVDVGVVGQEDITVGIGGEIYVASPVIFFLFSELLFDLLSPSAQTDWSAAETGMLGRVTIHYNALKTFEVYAAGLLGPNTYAFRATVTDEDGDQLRARFRTVGVRTGIAGGALHAWESGWTLSGELRYLITPRARSAGEIDLVNGSGDVVSVLDTVLYQRGPKGFSWQIMAGHRF
jgi:hypothetical protein